MAQVKRGDTVSVHYTGKLSDGTVFDSSRGRDPLVFTLGDGQIIPGFEEAILGMNPGESKAITIPATKAYGPQRKDMQLVIERDKLPKHLQLEVGQMLQIKQTDDQALVVTVIAISESNVTVDANHPLAGKDLTFNIQLVRIV